MPLNSDANNPICKCGCGRPVFDKPEIERSTMGRPRKYRAGHRDKIIATQTKTSKQNNPDYNAAATVKRQYPAGAPELILPTPDPRTPLSQADATFFEGIRQARKIIFPGPPQDAEPILDELGKVVNQNAPDAIERQKHLVWLRLRRDLGLLWPTESDEARRTEAFEQLDKRNNDLISAATSPAICWPFLCEALLFRTNLYRSHPLRDKSKEIALASSRMACAISKRQLHKHRTSSVWQLLRVHALLLRLQVLINFDIDISGEIDKRLAQADKLAKYSDRARLGIFQRKVERAMKRGEQQEAVKHFTKVEEWLTRRQLTVWEDSWALVTKIRLAERSAREVLLTQLRANVEQYQAGYFFEALQVLEGEFGRISHPETFEPKSFRLGAIIPALYEEPVLDKYFLGQGGI